MLQFSSNIPPTESSNDNMFIYDTAWLENIQSRHQFETRSKVVLESRDNPELKPVKLG